MKTTPSIIVSFLFVACASTQAPAVPGSTASATIKAITPRAGAEIDARTVFEADIDYAIANFNSESEYYLAPLFDSTEGAGRTFNEFEHITDAWKLNQPSGTVHVRYPIAREWRNPSLARPVGLTFKVMVRTGAHSTKVIGET